MCSLDRSVLLAAAIAPQQGPASVMPVIWVTSGPRMASALRCGSCLHKALLRACSDESHHSFCVLPGSQCAANCSSCDAAGAGKCDECYSYYKLTKKSTCAPVRLLLGQAWGVAACARTRPRCARAAVNVTRLTLRAPWIAVC